MTGYCIDVGYNSAWNNEEVWEELKKVVINICKNPEILIDEIKRETDERIPEGFIEAYKWPCKDLTIRIMEYDDIEDNYISQAASGGGNRRNFKEICRRAFCRLVLLEMHKKGMEII